MKLTAAQTLHDTGTLWDWLATHPRATKADTTRNMTERYVAARQIADAAWDAFKELQKEG